MIWLWTLSVVAGCLLARHFKIVVLVPVTFALVMVAVAVHGAQSADIWSIVSTVTVASVGIQMGYFLGILIDSRSGKLLTRGPLPSSAKMVARLPSIFRTPISR